MNGPQFTPALDALVLLVDPPRSGGTLVDWERAVLTYGHGFPSDYIEFMAVYGEGTFDDFFTVNAPFPDAYPNDAASSIRGVTENARLTGEEEGYDAPGLLVGWGSSVDAHLLCWRTEDPDPDRWTTVVFGAGDGWTELDCGMAEVLCRWASNRIPYFAVEQMDLPYAGSRFLRDQDEKRLRRAGIDPWGAHL